MKALLRSFPTFGGEGAAQGHPTLLYLWAAQVGRAALGVLLFTPLFLKCTNPIDFHEHKAPQQAKQQVYRNRNENDTSARKWSQIRIQIRNPCFMRDNILLKKQKQMSSALLKIIWNWLLLFQMNFYQELLHIRSEAVFFTFPSSFIFLPL